MTHGNQVTVAFFRGSPEYKSAFINLCAELKLGVTSLLDKAVLDYAKNQGVNLDDPDFVALSNRQPVSTSLRSCGIVPKPRRAVHSRKKASV